MTVKTRQLGAKSEPIGKPRKGRKRISIEKRVGKNGSKGVSRWWGSWRAKSTLQTKKRGKN